jgi:hypothetical protein
LAALGFAVQRVARYVDEGLMRLRHLPCDGGLGDVDLVQVPRAATSLIVNFIHQRREKLI